MARGGDGEQIDLLMLDEREDWMSGQDASKLWKILNTGLKMYLFDLVGMLCILRIVIA